MHVFWAGLIWVFLTCLFSSGSSLMLFFSCHPFQSRPGFLAFSSSWSFPCVFFPYSMFSCFLWAQFLSTVFLVFLSWRLSFRSFFSCGRLSLPLSGWLFLLNLCSVFFFFWKTFSCELIFFFFSLPSISCELTVSCVFFLAGFSSCGPFLFHFFLLGLFFPAFFSDSLQLLFFRVLLLVLFFQRFYSSIFSFGLFFFRGFFSCPVFVLNFPFPDFILLQAHFPSGYSWGHFVSWAPCILPAVVLAVYFISG